MDAYKVWADQAGRDLLEFATDGELYSSKGKSIVPMPTEQWPLTGFTEAFGIAMMYFAFVVFGRIIMTILPPLDKYTYPLRFVYNVAQVMLCSYMTVEAGMVAARHDYSVRPCNPFSATAPPIAPVLWLFYVSKVFDFFDTFFIILGKKWHQLSFLHVYHHLTIFLVYWMNVRPRLTCPPRPGSIARSTDCQLHTVARSSRCCPTVSCSSLFTANRAAQEPQQVNLGIV
jgi:elongation of very long chain fatty acids protein 4